MSTNKNDWLNDLNLSRNFYTITKQQSFIPDPYSEDYANLSVDICNPLSVDIEVIFFCYYIFTKYFYFKFFKNPWHNMFESQSLLYLIQNDLERT